MGNRISVSILSVLFLVAAMAIAAGPPPGAPTDKDPEAYKGFSEEGVARLKKGEILILKRIKGGDNPSGMIEAALIFNQNIEKVWECLVYKVEDQRKFLPYLEKSKLFEKRDNHYIVDFHLTILGTGIDYRVDHVAEKDKYYFHWELDPNYKNNLRVLKGYYRFYWIDEGHTLARYGTWFEIGIFIPKFIQAFLIKRDLPKALDNVRSFVDSDGKWRKEDYKEN